MLLGRLTPKVETTTGVMLKDGLSNQEIYRCTLMTSVCYQVWCVFGVACSNGAATLLCFRCQQFPSLRESGKHSISIFPLRCKGQQDL